MDRSGCEDRDIVILMGVEDELFEIERNDAAEHSRRPPQHPDLASRAPARSGFPGLLIFGITIALCVALSTLAMALGWYPR
jgi:hypothetical protein